MPGLLGRIFFFAARDRVSVAFRLVVVLATPEVPAFTKAKRGLCQIPQTSPSPGELPLVQRKQLTRFPSRLQLQLRYRGRLTKEWTWRQIARSHITPCYCSSRRTDLSRPSPSRVLPSRITSFRCSLRGSW